MRIAVICTGLEVAARFDGADCLTCYTVEKGVMSGCQTLPSSVLAVADVSSVFSQLGVDVVLCGALPADYAVQCREAGIEVVAQLKGVASQVARDYVNASLSGFADEGADNQDDDELWED